LTKLFNKRKAGNVCASMYVLPLTMQERTPAISLVVTLLSTLYKNETTAKQQSTVSTDPHQVNRPIFILITC